MAYNNLPDWETYKLLDDYKESSFKSQYKKHITDKDSWDNIAPMKDWKLEDYQELHLYIADGDLIPHEYYPNSWIAKEEEEEEEEAHKKKKLKIVIKKSSSAIEEIDDLMVKLTERFLEKTNSVNMSKEEKDVIDYFSGKKNAKSRKRR